MNGEASPKAGPSTLPVQPTTHLNARRATVQREARLAREQLVVAEEVGTDDVVVIWRRVVASLERILDQLERVP